MTVQSPQRVQDDHVVVQCHGEYGDYSRQSHLVLLWVSYLGVDYLALNLSRWQSFRDGGDARHGGGGDDGEDHVRENFDYPVRGYAGVNGRGASA